MKKAIFILTFLLACNQRSPQQQASKDSANAIKESMDDLDQSSVKFATKAADRNNKEIALGKIAQQNAEYDRIKDFAARMIKEHVAANEALQKASYSSGVTLPTAPEDQQDMADFSEKKGPAFDKAYIKEMVDEHQKMLELLDEASSQLKDTALKNYAITMLPKVKGHVEEARVLLEDVRKQYRPEQGRDAHIK
jgi:putative membrane protein